jgi:hypothetical protein
MIMETRLFSLEYLLYMYLPFDFSIKKTKSEYIRYLQTITLVSFEIEVNTTRQIISKVVKSY